MNNGLVQCSATATKFAYLSFFSDIHNCTVEQKQETNQNCVLLFVRYWDLTEKADGI